LPLSPGREARAPRTIRNARNIANRWPITPVSPNTGQRRMASASFTDALNPAPPRRIGFGMGTAGERRLRVIPARSVSTAVCIWSFPFGEQRLTIASAAPEPAENSAGAALFSPRCGRSARGPRFRTKPLRRGSAEFLSRVERSASCRPNPLLPWADKLPANHARVYDCAGAGCDRRHTAIEKMPIHRDSWKSGPYFGGPVSPFMSAQCRCDRGEGA
jgi:hypothetical protein